MQVSPNWGRQLEMHQMMVMRKESKLNFSLVVATNFGHHKEDKIQEM
jgi:hypothetical protein